MRSQKKIKRNVLLTQNTSNIALFVLYNILVQQCINRSRAAPREFERKNHLYNIFAKEETSVHFANSDLLLFTASQTYQPHLHHAYSSGIYISVEKKLRKFA